MHKTQTMRDALQLLRTMHPDDVYAISEAFKDVRFGRHWQAEGVARIDTIILRTLNRPDEVHYDYTSPRMKRRLSARGVTGLALSRAEEGVNHFHQRINKRAQLKAHIDACAVDGMIGIVESGRDCDCVEYTHSRLPIPATIFHFHKLERETGEWADGPFHLSVVTPQEADDTPNESRDLVLEAFEDGHPHSIVSRFA